MASESSYQLRAVQEFEEWSLIIFISIIWALSSILQGGYATRYRFVYVIKLVLLWLLQPLTLGFSIYAAVYFAMPATYLKLTGESTDYINQTNAHYQRNYHTSKLYSRKGLDNSETIAQFTLAILFAVLTFVSWCKYMYDSIRLALKTKSAWSFSPETRLIAGIVDMMGNGRCVPLDYMTPILAPVIKHGTLKLHGQKLASGLSVKTVPKHMAVFTPSDTFHYVLRKTIESTEDDNIAVLIYQSDRASNAGLHTITTSGSGNSRLYKYM
ncbi:membrane protein [Common moorhen coronavirus HKU21]|uniref:Membrane protein n=1 Tax=Common moorhen coronavirus HKU21 TaxID=1159902 RepID=H9BR37_9NIDO|nr:membrane protein [Common moorhen coronavirus HKU21]AFD29246.1 membrane protein [Common moorhen coronavirus HKU21]